MRRILKYYYNILVYCYIPKYLCTNISLYSQIGVGGERHSPARRSPLCHSIRYSQCTCFTSTKVQSATESSLSLSQVLSLLALNPIPVNPITATRPDGARAAPPPHTQAYALQSGLDAYAAGSAYPGVCAAIGPAAGALHTQAQAQAPHTQAYALQSGEQQELRIRRRRRMRRIRRRVRRMRIQPLLQQQPSNRTVMPVVKLKSKLSSKLEEHRHRHASSCTSHSSHSHCSDGCHSGGLPRPRN